MKSSTIDNYQNRTIYLEKIIQGEIKVDLKKLHYFNNLKSFCGLAVTSFEEISYNSLKNAAQFIDGSPPVHSEAWEKLKSLFNDAKQIVNNSARLDPPVLPNAIELAEKALLDAHICTMAFIELLTYLQNLAETLDKDPLHAADRIRTQLDISKAKFKSIISCNDNYSDAIKSIRLVKK